jgi:hypothetical protein
MKKHLLYSASIVFGSLIIAAALVFARQRVRGQSDNSEQWKELKTRIAHLETKAAALQQKLDQVHKQTPTVIYTPANQIFPPATTGSAPVKTPPGWKPFEFNGLTYYLTPLGQGTEVSMAPARQTDALVFEPFEKSK